MCLADKIVLQRKKHGWSQEELADRLEVSRQSVSKWESGLSNPELDKVIAMSLLFGVSTDYLLKEEINASEAADDPSDRKSAPMSPASETMQNPVVRVVSKEEAEQLTELSSVLSWRVAIGVLLCIFSPVVLLFCAGLSEIGILSEAVAVTIGLLSLFAHVAVAVALFVPAGVRAGRFEYLEQEQIRLQDGLEAVLRQRLAEYEKTHLILLTVGVVLCILGVVPLITVACLFEDAVFAMVVCLCLLLIVVAVGVFLIVHTSYIVSGFQKLLQEGDYSARKKRHHARSEAVMTIYWCIVTAVYLAVSFLTFAWNITWVIWVVAALCSPVLELLSGIGKNDKEC